MGTTMATCPPACTSQTQLGHCQQTPQAALAGHIPLGHDCPTNPPPPTQTSPVFQFLFSSGMVLVYHTRALAQTLLKVNIQVDFLLEILTVWSPCCQRLPHSLQHCNSKASVFWHSAFLIFQLSTSTWISCGLPPTTQSRSNVESSNGADTSFPWVSLALFSPLVSTFRKHLPVQMKTTARSKWLLLIYDNEGEFSPQFSRLPLGCCSFIADDFDWASDSLGPNLKAGLRGFLTDEETKTPSRSTKTAVLGLTPWPTCTSPAVRVC